MPRAVVITKLDQARADYDGVLAAAQAAFGDKVLPLYVPVRDGSGEVTGLVDLMTDDGEHEDLRGALIEGIIEESEDETLMDRYLGGEEISHETLTEDLEKAVARGSLPPRRTRLLDDRRRLRRAARPRRRRLPLAAGAPRARGVHPGRQGGRRHRGRPAGRARRRGREDLERPVRRPGQPGPRLLRHSHRRRPPVHVSGHFTSFFGDGAATRTTTRTRRSAALSYPFGRHARRRRPRWWPATSAPSAG